MSVSHYICNLKLENALYPIDFELIDMPGNRNYLQIDVNRCTKVKAIFDLFPQGHWFFMNTSCFRVACEAWRHIGITLSGVCLSVHLSVCLSGSHTFLVVTHSYVSQATHTFLGMLPLCLSYFDRDDDEEEDDKNTVKLTSFLSKKDSKHQRHTYFKDRCLSSFQSF